MLPDIVIRDLATADDYAACIELQKATWGRDFTECVPATMLRIAQKLGGIAAGAFDGRALAGFVFGLTGLYEGGVAHWSDMLAVRTTHRNRGIGELLKRYQREALLMRGIDRVYWSFDPLDAKNAHINFNRLGVFAREYVVDMYGATASPLHEGIGTDRLIAVWALTSSRVVARLAGAGAGAPDSEGPRIEIPTDIHAINAVDPARAREWRLATRQQFLQYLPQYVISGFVRTAEGGYYSLASADSFAA